MGSVLDAALEEHRAMADTLTKVGPDAPTLLEGWTTKDLAAHLASIDTAGGLPLFVGRQLITRIYPRPTKGSRKVAARALERALAKGYDWSVDRVRAPHRLPMRAGGGPVAIFEIFVHHQDVLRADPDLPPRAAPDELSVCLPWLLAFHAKQLDGIRLEVETEHGTDAVGEGAPVTVRGDAGEVVLWLAGRAPHCSVEVEGDPDVLDRLSPVTRI
ncbi:MAG TPA: maleylpyruvate isomerase family mycothiol-dependent enzyme [Acidimicrobiales bacterium]|nr:maleylpyruvate isomerase family mycothiol-dependent enzyme [Acidimicrobiales bacterium]